MPSDHWPEMLDQFLDFYPSFGVDTALLLLVLVALEAVLSADNAIALAAIAQGLQDPQQRTRALNFGLVAAFILRIALILLATWVIRYWQIEMVGALYLLWLSFKFFTGENDDDGEGHKAFRFQNLWQAVPTIAFTDLAFSLDSVTTAIAISDHTWLVLTGGTLGIITLRFMAGLFIRWLDEYENLAAAGYVTVGFVGARLFLKAIEGALGVDLWIPPDWMTISFIAITFIWGFSVRKESVQTETVAAESIAPNPNSEAQDQPAPEPIDQR